MNKGTKIRTALRIAVSLNTAIYAVSAAVGALGFGWLTMAWAIFTIISDFAVSALTTYFNQDYTQEACIGTGITRQLKAEKNANYAGEYFYTNKIEDTEKFTKMIAENRKLIGETEKTMSDMARADKNVAEYVKQFDELKKQLPRWYELLSHDGMNSKMMVKNDIQYQLNKTKAGVKSNDSD